MRSAAVARCAAVAAALLGLAACSGTPSASPSDPDVTTTGSPSNPGSSASTPAPTGSSGSVAPTTDGSSPAGPPSSPDESIEPLPGPSSQESVLESLPGNPDADTCVEVGDQRDVRSGGMAAGNFAQARETFADISTGGPATVSLYWIPEHAADLSGLTVRGTQIGGDLELTVTDATVGEAEEWRYYLAEIVVPAPGRWELEASSGDDRGCFTVIFGS